MDRRNLFGGLVAAVGGILLTKPALSQSKNCYTKDKNSVRWTVPSDIRRIKVRSWSKDGDEVIDTHFRVRPGQVFQIDVVNED